MPTDSFLAANGLRHHVVSWGDAGAPETIVCCHGFLDLAWGFDPLARRLVEAGYRVLAFDFRGHGESEWIGKGGYYHFVDYVLDVHDLLPQLASAPVHLVGHSMGGTVATLYAGSHPSRIRSLTLLEGYGPPTLDLLPVERVLAWIDDVERARTEAPAQLADVDAAALRLRRRHSEIDEAFLRLLAEKSTRPHPSGGGLTWRFDPLHRSRSPLGFDRERFQAFASRIEAPVLIVQGEHGLRTGDDEARIAFYPRARRQIVAGAAHMLQWTHPDAVAALVIPFLRSSG